jgi:LuxR family maltose regulon positive regulatory protein
MEYLFTEVLSKQPPQMIQYLLATAILDRFCGPLCEAMCLPGADPDPSTYRINGWDFIAWLKKKNLFLIPLDPQNRWFRYHHLFQRLLYNQLIRHRRAGEIKSLHTRASAWYFENDLIEEGLQHALAAGDAKTASSVVTRLGPQLMDEQSWQRLERWLRLLRRDQVEQDPELLLLETWLYHTRHDYSNQMACHKMIEALAASTAPNTLFSAKRIQGQLDALRGIKHYIAGDGQSALTHLQRACENVPNNLTKVRNIVHIYLLGAYQMVGDFAGGLSDYKKTVRRLTSRDRTYHSAYLTSLCAAYWIDANLYAMRQTAEIALIADKHHHLPDTLPYVLYYQGIFHYQRNELKKAEEKLTEVVESYDVKSPMNYSHSAFALALCYLAQGKHAQARKISKAIIAYTVKSNNADILQIAKAFEAELALRQGSIAKASRLARSLDTLKLQPIHKFYFPQLTLIKILLAEGTMDSSRQAAELLDQSLNFMRSIHNRRFQIDLLALQSLLFDSQRNEPEALKALTESLTIAQPAGFIRPFVDLGPLVADLLKRLRKQKIAVNYIEKLLAAFRREGEQTVVLETLDQPTTPPHERRHPSPLSQPLAEPLTNRELDVLVLLAQRLSNKEIAGNLFISTRTVKAHLQNIYGKLNVNRRRDAVEKAKRIRIL